MPSINLSSLTSLNLVDRLRVGQAIPIAEPTALAIGTIDADRLSLRNDDSTYNMTVQAATLAADVTLTLPAVTGTLMVQGGPATTDLDMGGNRILNIGNAGTDFLASGGLTLANALTVTTGGAAITGASSTIGGVSSAITGYATNMAVAPSGNFGATTGSALVASYTGLTYDQSTTFVAGVLALGGGTVSGGVTIGRISALRAEPQTVTVTGALTSHSALYCATPINGSTVRVIDTATGGYLTTGGIWTDNPSWAAIKRDITPVEAADVDRLLSWFATDYKPVRYRYADKWEDIERPVFKTVKGERVQTGTKTERVLACYERDSDHPHFGYLLDDLPQEIREIVCADESGGIAGKDERGLLLALVARLSARVQGLEGR